MQFCPVKIRLFKQNRAGYIYFIKMNMVCETKTALKKESSIYSRCDLKKVLILQVLFF